MADNYPGNGAYNIYSGFSDFSYKCISYLMDNNELIWKLLKYKDPEAWDKANLTVAEKAALIYKGQEDTSTSNVFMDVGQPDAWTREDCILRISPHSIFPDNRTVGTMSMLFEIYAHYKCNHLSNYKVRIDWITEELIGLFNGVNIAGIGRLFMDRVALFDSRAIPGGQTPYKGRWMIFGNKMG